MGGQGSTAVSPLPLGAGTPSALVTVDTTAASLPHRLTGYYAGGEVTRPPSGAKAYSVAIAITYVPLFVLAMLSPLPAAAITATLHLPFLYDWNVGFMFLVSFPTLFALTVLDQHVLATALRQVQMDGIVLVSPEMVPSLSSRWQQKFRSINVWGQAIGVLVGAVVACFNYIAYTPEKYGFWIASHGRLLPVGFAFLFCIFLCYSLIPVYVLRSLGISVFLKDVVRNAELHLLPFHPDRSGGLRPVGQLGVRNQYALTVFGFNILLLAVISRHYLGLSSSLYGLIGAAAVAYIILGPFVFLGPLLPFRTGMLRAKADLMGEVARRLRVELHRLREQLSGGTISKEDEELIDRLRKVGAVIDELPVWPFDAGTLRKFLTAYVIPLLGTLGYSIVKIAFTALTKWMHS